MIWNSVPLMTAIDLVIIAVTLYAIWCCLLMGPSKRPSAPQVGLRLIAAGMLLVCVFYSADLVSMYVLPTLPRHKKQWRSWALSIAISAGWSFCSP